MSYTKNYNKLYKNLSPLIRKLYRLEVVGEENIPEDGGIIVASNHTALSDVLILSAASGGRQIRYMAKKELFRTPIIAPLIKALGAFPVDRASSDVASIKKMISIVEDGEAAGIFPQGTRRGGLDPRTTEVKPGVGMIAYRTKAPVVPVLIENRKMKSGLFRKNRIVFGKPIYYEDLGFENGGKAEYEAASALIFARICDMLSTDLLPAPTEKQALPSPTDEKGDAER